MDRRTKEAPANKQVMPYQEPHGARSAQGKLLEEAIGRQVKQYREKLGLTIAELAKAAWFVRRCPPTLPINWAWLGLALIVVAWLSTLLLQAPRHLLMAAQGFDAESFEPRQLAQSQFENVVGLALR